MTVLSKRFCVSGFILSVMLLVAISVPVALAQNERITLEVALTAGRNPDVNLVQDYGIVSWADILAEEFKKEYPHIDVVFRVANLDQIAVMIAAGIGPDIINGAATAFVSMGRRGAFEDLTPLLAADGIDYEKDQVFWPEQFSAFQYKGKVFALPQYLGTLAMQYNADMFAYAGIADPEPRADINTMDWDEFASIAQKLTRDTTGDGVPDEWGFQKVMGGNRVHYWQIAAGAELYGNEERSVSALNSPEAIAGLEFLQSLRWNSRVIQPPSGTSASWSLGNVAISERGSWEMVRYLGLGSDGHPKVSFDWNVFPMPIGPSGKRASFATIDAYAMNKNTQYPEETYALLKFLAGPVANEVLAKYLGLQPAHRDVIPEYIGLMRELNRDVYDINMHVFTDAGPYAHPQFLYSEPDLATGILYNAYTRVLDQNEPAGPVWTEAIERLNRVLAAAGREIVADQMQWLGQTWRTRDFNTAAIGGAAVQDDDALVVSGAGADIWGSRDGFHYVYQQVEGDFTATVRLQSVPDTDNWSKAGIMLRMAETDGSPNVAVLGTLKNGVVMQERLHENAASRTAGRTTWDSTQPVYLRLVRVGNRVTGLMSLDGNSWTTLSDVDIQLPNQVLLGLATTSHSVGVVGDAVFTGWEVTY